MHGAKGDIAAKIVRGISLRLKFLNNVGLTYLSLDRSAETLSGGESQRIGLVSQIGRQMPSISAKPSTRTPRWARALA
jgi:excinuclease ABC subunit A